MNKFSEKQWRVSKGEDGNSERFDIVYSDDDSCVDLYAVVEGRARKKVTKKVQPPTQCSEAKTNVCSESQGIDREHHARRLRGEPMRQQLHTDGGVNKNRRETKEHDSFIDTRRPQREDKNRCHPVHHSAQMEREVVGTNIATSEEKMCTMKTTLSHSASPMGIVNSLEQIPHASKERVEGRREEYIRKLKASTVSQRAGKESAIEYNQSSRRVIRESGSSRKLMEQTRGLSDGNLSLPSDDNGKIDRLKKLIQSLEIEVNTEEAAHNRHGRSQKQGGDLGDSTKLPRSGSDRGLLHTRGMREHRTQSERNVVQPFVPKQSHPRPVPVHRNLSESAMHCRRYSNGQLCPSSPTSDCRVGQQRSQSITHTPSKLNKSAKTAHIKRLYGIFGL